MIKRNLNSKLLLHNTSDNNILLSKRSVYILHIKLCWIKEFIRNPLLSVLHIINIVVSYVCLLGAHFILYCQQKQHFMKICKITNFKLNYLVNEVENSELPCKGLYQNYDSQENNNKSLCIIHTNEASPLSLNLPLLVKRKILILDLDETLIHSYHENNILWRNSHLNMKSTFSDNSQTMLYCLSNIYGDCNYTMKDLCFNAILSISKFLSILRIEMSNGLGHSYTTSAHTSCNKYLKGLIDNNHLYCKNRNDDLMQLKLTQNEGLLHKTNKLHLPCGNVMPQKQPQPYNLKPLTQFSTKNNINQYQATSYDRENQFKMYNVHAILQSSNFVSYIYRLYLLISFVIITLPKIFIHVLFDFYYYHRYEESNPNNNRENIYNYNNSSSSFNSSWNDLKSYYGSLGRKKMGIGLGNVPPNPNSAFSHLNFPTSKAPDFTLKLCIDRHPVRFFVYKRPHVETFLNVVSQWYDLVVYTASMQVYGEGVADHLDKPISSTRSSLPSNNPFYEGDDWLLNNRRAAAATLNHNNNCAATIFPRRYYRQHCKAEPTGGFSKDISMVESDLSRVFILDNSPAAYKTRFPHNGVHIKSWFSDPQDRSLLELLPFLDSLRFVSDVRNVLSRNVHTCRPNNTYPPSSSASPFTTTYGGDTIFNTNLSTGARKNNLSLIQREIDLYGGGTATPFYEKVAVKEDKLNCSSTQSPYYDCLPNLFITFPPVNDIPRTTATSNDTSYLLSDNNSRTRRNSQKLEFTRSMLPPSTVSPPSLFTFSGAGSSNLNFSKNSPLLNKCNQSTKQGIFTAKQMGTSFSSPTSSPNSTNRYLKNCPSTANNIIIK